MIRSLQPNDVDACGAILGRLPQWFGIEAANAAYIESLRRLPGFVAVDGGALTGFLALELHTPTSAEITVMGVEPAVHRRGTGRALVATAEDWCRAREVRWLHVKTRGPSTYDEDYERNASLLPRGRLRSALRIADRVGPGERGARPREVPAYCRAIATLRRSSSVMKWSLSSSPMSSCTQLTLPVKRLSADV